LTRKDTPLEEIIRAIVLGIVQGATEFIPVSSSAHLVIVPWLLGWPDPSLLFDTILHWGTLLALLLVFWQDVLAIVAATLQSLVRRSLADPNARLGWYIVLGTIPAVAVGFLFEDGIETLFGSALTAGSLLLVTAVLLAGSEYLTRRRSDGADVCKATWGQAVAVGCAQAVALAPGISRSGSTIATGLVAGMRREAAARFSFLLGMPAIFGAGLLQMIQVMHDGGSLLTGQMPALVLGFLASALVGYGVIRGLLAYLRRHSLYLFAAYCMVLGLIVIGLSLRA
jgi:undecaprenyl-diphosphatase